MRKYGKFISMLVVSTMFMVMLGIFQTDASILDTYTVKSGDTLWKVSAAVSVTVNDLKLLNGITTDAISVGQVLKLKPDSHLYIVKSGDSLWLIANKFGITVTSLKALNGLVSDSIYIGQSLKTMPDTISYVVKTDDMLYTIATKFNVTVLDIKSINVLTSDVIYVGQTLLIPYKLQPVIAQTPTPTPTPTPTVTRPSPVLSWPSVTYIVQAGDNASIIASKFGATSSNIMKYNYMSTSDWFNAGEKIAINGYAPRNYAVVEGEDSAPTHFGHLVDWFLDGKYLLRRNAVFTITDLQTGKSFTIKVLGGYNHADVEPLTANDTNVMKQLWATWEWTPRPVVIFKDGMNIAASLSGMPHSFDTTPDNGVVGHFDCYLKNSIPHGVDTSQVYVNQHYANVNKAAGIQ